MKVVLLKDVPTLGKSGDVKEVAEGYFRNYLAKHGLAAAATDAAMRSLAEQKETAARKEQRQAKANETLAQRIAKVQITMHVKVGEQHRLYGSITSQDVAEALAQKLGRPVDKHLIELEEPIRHLGTYEVPIRLAHGLTPKVTVVVEPQSGGA